MPRRGPKRKYLHFGKKPQPPKDKKGRTLAWTPAELDDSNEAFVQLKAGLLDESISPLNKPHLVYNSNPFFYVISPAKWPKFFVKTVKEVLGIDIDPDEGDQESNVNCEESATSDSHSIGTSTASHPTVPSYLQTSTATKSDSHPNLPTKMSSSAYVGTSSPQFSNFEVDDNGLVTDATPVARLDRDSPHMQVVLESYQD